MHLESIINSLKNSGKNEFENDEKLQELYLNYDCFGEQKGR